MGALQTTNSSSQTSASIIGGVYSLTPPIPIVGQGVPFQVDSNGNLLVNVAVGGSGGGGIQYADGAAPATPTGTVALGRNPSNVLHVLPLSALGNLSVNLAEGTISGGNAAAGPTGSAVPASAGYTGFSSAGNLIGVSAANPLPVIQAAAVDVSDRLARLLGHVTVDNASIAVTGTFFQATQPVSLAAAVDVSDRAPRLLGHVTVDNASLAVTGTFFQTTQPVSIAAAVDVSDRIARLLGHVTVDNASLAVTGTFFQATQPVSGTFFQATQPVSLAAAVDVSDRAARLLGHVTVDNASLAVTGTFFQATQPISGTVTANQGTANATPWNANVAQVGGTAAAATVKGTQAANGIGVQDLKDSGRVIKVFSASFTAATTEALVTLTPITDGTAAATGTSFAITAGKRFRIQALLIATKNAGAAIQGVICNLRMSASGAVTAASPLIATVGAGTLSATANNVNAESAAIPDGLELSGTMQFGISQVGTATAGNIITLIGYEY